MLSRARGAPVIDGQLPPAGIAVPLRPARLKERRRPWLVAAMVALVCLGGLVSAWAYRSASNTQEVLAVRGTVHRGEIITRGDLMTVSVGVDPALHPLAAGDASQVVGKRAALDLAAGSLVTPTETTTALQPGAGLSMVGVPLAPGMMPTEPLLAGDTVRLVTTPGQDGNPAAVGDPTVVTATVVATGIDPDSGTAVVDVTVPAAQAPVLAARAATGKVALVLDSREQ